MVVAWLVLLLRVPDVEVGRLDLGLEVAQVLQHRLLALERWVPHQVLLSQGALVDLSDEEDARVAFVSHQWTGFGHPDPSGAQLRHLQRVVRRLRNGELDVNNHMILELIYGFQACTTAEEWTEKLGGGFYFWIHYLSIPLRNPVLKELSISSLGIYSSFAKYVVIVRGSFCLLVMVMPSICNHSL